MRIKILAVKNGDAITINYLGNSNKYHNIFIDCGYNSTYVGTVRKETEQIFERSQKIDLFILTHTDQDHISGIFPFLKEWLSSNIINEFFYNYSTLKLPMPGSDKTISIKQGISLRDKLQEYGLINYEYIDNEIEPIDISGASIIILSPTRKILDRFKQKWNELEVQHFKTTITELSSRTNDYNLTLDKLFKNNFSEDSKVENGSSIAFLLGYKNRKILFMGDAWPSTVEDSLRKLGYSETKKLKIDYLKLSHHGSKYSTSDKLLNLIGCSNFIITGNGYGFPHKETLAKILNVRKGFKTTFIFNHNNSKLKSIFTKDEIDRYNITCLYPEENDNGYVINI